MVLLCIAGIIVVIFLRRQCRRETETASSGDAGNGNGLIRSDSAVNQMNGVGGTAGSSASTISKTSARGGVNPRSQSLKPLMGSVDCDLDSGGPMFVARIEPDRWTKNQMFCHTNTTQLGWPVGEPPPSSQTALPPPPLPLNMMMTHQQSIEAGLITPPYTTDSSLELRSPDIIPPPIIGRSVYNLFLVEKLKLILTFGIFLSIGSCDFGPATLPRSYKGFGMGSSSALAGAMSTTTTIESKKPHVTWSDTMPKAFRQSHEFLRRETSSSPAASNKRESVV